MIAPQDVTNVAIIGNGLMGQGMAQVYARAGKNVSIIGRNDDSLARARSAIEANVAAFVDRGLTSEDEAATLLDRITTGTDYNAAGKADFVIEAVPA